MTNKEAMIRDLEELEDLMTQYLAETTTADEPWEDHPVFEARSIVHEELLRAEEDL